MAIMVRDLPMDERPREKLVKYGPSYLSNAELLAILLRTGTKESSVLHVAEEVLSHFEGQGLSGLVHMSPDEIAQVNGVGPAKAATILAAVELGRRLARAEKVHRNHGELHRSAALDEHDRPIVAEAAEFFENRDSLLVDCIVIFAAVRHFHHGHPRALVVDKILLRRLENFERQGRRTRRKVVCS